MSAQLTAERAVKLAAKIMDKRQPSWFRRIVFKRLNISLPCDCIGGQTGLDWYELEREFWAKYDQDETLHPFASNAFRDLWIDEVRARRAKAKA